MTLEQLKREQRRAEDAYYEASRAYQANRRAKFDEATKIIEAELLPQKDAVDSLSAENYEAKRAVEDELVRLANEGGQHQYAPGTKLFRVSGSRWIPWLPKMSAEQFYDFCKKHGSCSAGLRSIRGKSLAEWWGTSRHGGWMLYFCMIRFSSDKFSAVRDALREGVGSTLMNIGSKKQYAAQAAWLRENVKVRP